MYHLMFVAAMMPTANVGQFDTHAQCQSAIRQIFESKVDAASLTNKTVQQAIDTQMKYQRSYICVERK